jgi:hypothetical protein
MDRRQKEEEAKLIIALGSQGTATLAIMLKLLRAFIAKGLLSQIEVVAILDAAAESAEKAPDAFGGTYAQSTGATIRQMLGQFLDAPETDQKH